MTTNKSRRQRFFSFLGGGGGVQYLIVSSGGLTCIYPAAAGGAGRCPFVGAEAGVADAAATSYTIFGSSFCFRSRKMILYIILFIFHCLPAWGIPTRWDLPHSLYPCSISDFRGGKDPYPSGPSFSSSLVADFNVAIFFVVFPKVPLFTLKKDVPVNAGNKVVFAKRWGKKYLYVP